MTMLIMVNAVTLAAHVAMQYGSRQRPNAALVLDTRIFMRDMSHDAGVTLLLLGASCLYALEIALQFSLWGAAFGAVVYLIGFIWFTRDMWCRQLTMTAC